MSPWFRAFRATKVERGLAVLGVAIALSACASVPRHSEYRPADGSYRLVRVEMGDTLSEIAHRYHVDEDDIAAMNRLYDHDVLRAGEMLRVPAYGRVAYAPAREPLGPRPVYHPHRTQQTSIQTRPLPAPVHRETPSAPEPKQLALATPPRPIPKPHVAVVTPKPSTSDTSDGDAAPVTHHEPEPRPTNPNVTDARFMWPLDGVVISNFGSRTGGERNDGINIACTGGEEIRAAADGTVMYAGNELKAYGNLVLIKHGDNFTSAYAHVDRIVVTRGAHVHKGQIIAYAGSTGDVAEPQLHFELRRGTTPIDPRPYLASND